MRIDSLNNQLRIFRDDLYPFLGGGNKGRKMVAIGKDILQKKANALVTTGGIQSNHCRAVAVFAARHQMACTLVMHGSPTDFEKQSGNAKIMRMAGAEIRFVKNPEEIGPTMDSAVKDYREKGMNPYYIYGGGHTLEGGKAYIDAVEELKIYGERENWIPDYIFLASGTGSTQGGILAGLNRSHWSTKVVGISVGRSRAKAEEIVTEFYGELCQTHQIHGPQRPVVVLEDYLCGGYGRFDQNIQAVSRQSLQKYGFTLDLCYTAKAFYGMLDFVKKNKLENAQILFWHTGGIFNFLAE